MTSRVIRNDGAFTRIDITCDHIDCDVKKDDHEIAEAGGLTKMGWQTAMGDDHKLKHYCPAHNR